MTRQIHEVATYFSHIFKGNAGNEMEVAFIMTNKVIEFLDLDRDKEVYNSNDGEVKKTIFSSIRNCIQIENTKGGRMRS